MSLPHLMPTTVILDIGVFAQKSRNKKIFGRFRPRLLTRTHVFIGHYAYTRTRWTMQSALRLVFCSINFICFIVITVSFAVRFAQFARILFDAVAYASHRCTQHTHRAHHHTKHKTKPIPNIRMCVYVCGWLQQSLAPALVLDESSAVVCRTRIFGFCVRITYNLILLPPRTSQRHT